MNVTKYNKMCDAERDKAFRSRAAPLRKGFQNSPSAQTAGPPQRRLPQPQPSSLPPP